MSKVEKADSVRTEVLKVVQEYVDQADDGTNLEKALDTAYRRQLAFDVWKLFTLRETGYEDLARAKTPREMIQIVERRLQPAE